MQKIEIPPICYIFDSSSLIQLERRQNGKGLKEMPEPPGKWLVVPSKVAKQVNNQGAPSETKSWIESGKPAVFTTEEEKSLYITIRVYESLLEDADIQGIVLAYHRKGTYVVEEGRARKRAISLGVRCITIDEFLLEIQPSLF